MSTPVYRVDLSTYTPEDNITFSQQLVVTKEEGKFNYRHYTSIDDEEPDMAHVTSTVLVMVPGNIRTSYLALVPYIAQELTFTHPVIIKHGTLGKGSVQDLLDKITINGRPVRDFQQYFSLCC